MKRLMFIIEIIVVLVIGGLVTYEYIKLKSMNNRFDARNNDFTPPDVVGEISVISENSITLKIIDMKKPEDRSEVQNESKDTTLETIPTFRHVEYTGETKDFFIPDGFKITSRSKEELYVKDLKVGDIIGITYKEDKTTIDSIRLINLKAPPKDSNIIK